MGLSISVDRSEKCEKKDGLTWANRRSTYGTVSGGDGQQKRDGESFQLAGPKNSWVKRITEGSRPAKKHGSQTRSCSVIDCLGKRAKGEKRPAGDNKRGMTALRQTTVKELDEGRSYDRTERKQRSRHSRHRYWGKKAIRMTAESGGLGAGTKIFRTHYFCTWRRKTITKKPIAVPSLFFR